MLCFLSSLSLCFFLIFFFLIKMFTKFKSRLSSFNLPSNLLFHQGSFFVFESLLVQTNSGIYSAAAYIVLLSSVRFQISIFLSTQLTLFIAHFSFAFGIPRNDYSFSFLYTNIVSCSNISFSSSCKTLPCFSASLGTTSHLSLLLYRS